MVDFAKLVQDLPLEPGVYIWKDGKGNPLYIGKAKMLKKLRAENVAYRLVVFNADAVQRPETYLAKSEPSMLYLPVDVRGWAPR